MFPKRILIALVLCGSVSALSGQSLRINEIARTGDVPVALQYVQLELYNAGSEATELKGIRFYVDRQFQEVQQSVVLMPGEFAVFNFGKGKSSSPFDMDLNLPWKGSTISLWDTDGTTLLDLFSYISLMDEGSFGRCPDGDSRPAYAERATIGGPCALEQAKQARSGAVQVRVDRRSRTVELHTQGSDQIRFTLNGTEPMESSTLYTAPFIWEGNGVIKARAFANGKLPGPLATACLVLPESGRNTIAINIDEDDLWNEDFGIYTEGKHANFSRKGKQWERSAQVEFFAEGSDAPNIMELGIRIAGSGTRSLAKRSFKLFTRDRYGENGLEQLVGIPVDEVVLRADGTPQSFLKNKFIELVADAYATSVDVQSSKSTDIYLNGKYWGAYRIMPSKDPLWVELKHDIAGCDMLAGPAHRIVAGNDHGWQEALALLSRSSLEEDEMNRLSQLVDLESLIQLAAFDLYTGRVDAELNTRVWRPHATDGKWRWVLYDFDLWTGPEDPSLGRMLAEPSAAAPFMHLIWNTPELRERLLGFMTALINGPLEAQAATDLMNKIGESERTHLLRDNGRWKDELDRPDPDEALEQMRLTVERRPTYLHQYLAAQSGMSPVTAINQHAKGGTVLLNGLPLGKVDQVRGWAGMVVLLEAVPDPGMSFRSWKGMDNTSPLVLVELDKLDRIQAVFERSAPARP